MPGNSLAVTRAQILDFRQTTGFLRQRLPGGKRSLRKIGWAGLQDSMPRAAVLSVHARMSGTKESVWHDPAFVQVWGPRYSVFVVPRQDLAVFTLGRLPERERTRQRAYDVAARAAAVLDGGTMSMSEAGKALGHSPNMLRYAAPTGTIVLRWDGARQPTVRSVPAPEVEPAVARKELARRFLHVFGPATPEGFSAWAGVPMQSALKRFEELHRSLTEVETPIGSASILTRDLETLRAPPPSSEAVRLLPSGDAYYLLQGSARELLVPRSDRRDRLWTSRVWPGAILAEGEIIGTWRRSQQRVTAEAWVRLPARLRRAVEAEATSLPLPVDGDLTLDWEE